MLFLGEALTTMIVYIGCRRNPYVVYNFFGLFRFQAPYLPWILVLFSVLFGGSVAVDLVGEKMCVRGEEGMSVWGVGEWVCLCLYLHV